MVECNMINTITPLWATTDTSGDSRLPVCETLHERVRIQVLRSRLDDRGAQGRQTVVDGLTRETLFRQVVQREYLRGKEPVPVPFTVDCWLSVSGGPLGAGAWLLLGLEGVSLGDGMGRSGLRGF